MSMYERIKIFLLGVVTALLFFLLIGAGGQKDDGRYAISSWAVVDENEQGIAEGFYVVDTHTGLVRGRQHAHTFKKDSYIYSVKGKNSYYWDKEYKE